MKLFVTCITIHVIYFIFYFNQPFHIILHHIAWNWSFLALVTFLSEIDSCLFKCLFRFCYQFLPQLSVTLAIPLFIYFPKHNFCSHLFWIDLSILCWNIKCYALWFASDLTLYIRNIFSSQVWSRDNTVWIKTFWSWVKFGQTIFWRYISNGIDPGFHSITVAASND